MLISFECILCSRETQTEFSNFHRELSSCLYCLSTVRQRELIHTFLNLVIEFKNPNVIGLSDHDDVQAFMNRNQYKYKNTYFDVEPLLNVSKPSKTFLNSADILISSDVLEHVMSTFEKSIIGHFEILKPGGWLIMTTPYFKDQPYVDKYPWMSSYSVTREGEINALGSEGIRKVSDPIFHGGPGNTLEMRLFAPETLKEALGSAGFTEIAFLEEDIPQYGIFRSTTQVGTIIAKKPSKRFLPLKRR